MRGTLLIVEDDPGMRELLAVEATARGLDVRMAGTRADAEALVAERLFDAALVDLLLGAESGLDVIRLLKDAQPDAEVVVISASDSLATAIASYELAVFAFVPKPFELDHLFATLDRALARRRLALDHRRLVWELQVVNDLSSAVSSSLDLEPVIDRTLAHIGETFAAPEAVIRLSGKGVARFSVRPGGDLPSPPAADAASVACDRVLATGEPLAIDDVRQHADFPSSFSARSIMGVPILAGDRLLGAIALSSPEPCRFTSADRRLLQTIARQLAVAVENARLYSIVKRGKREWERTFDAIGDPIAVYDAAGRIVRGNAALAAHLGCALTEVAGRSCADVGFCGGGCPDCAVGRAARLGDPVLAELACDDGQIFTVTTLPIRGGEAASAVVQVAKNVTEQIRSARRLQQMSDALTSANARLVQALEQVKATQAQLVQSEKLSAIGQLVAGVAHELNNPLTSVIGYAQLVEDELRGSPGGSGARPAVDIAQDVRRIAEESERAAKIVRNLLAFARRQTSERALQDVADLAARVLSLRAYELRLSDIEVATEFDPDLPPVLADANQIQQALLNLVLNAEQAVRGLNGERRIAVGAVYAAPAQAVRLFVRDNGHGIAESDLPRVFDPFFTTRPVGEGTGLGLSICYGIVRDHGGHIWAESRPFVATTFWIELPARRAAPTAPARVLVAHGDQALRDAFVAALRGWGHDAAWAATAAEALASLRGGRFDAVLADPAVITADLPGWRAERAERSRPALILAGAAGYHEDLDRFIREHAAGMVGPPFELRALRAALSATEEWV